MRAPSIIRLVVVMGVIAAGAGSAVVLLREHNRAKGQLEHTSALLEKMDHETERLESEKAQVVRAYETLQADVASYVALNTKLQEEAGQQQRQSAEAQRLLERKEGELKTLHDQLQTLRKALTDEKRNAHKALSEELELLKHTSSALETTLQHERAVSHYNMGALYAQARRYEEAVEAYETSLRFDPSDSDTHYNLGLLYEKVIRDPAQALSHYRTYLELNPDAHDRDEVQRWIDSLTTATPAH